MGRRRLVRLRHNGSSSLAVKPLKHFCKTIYPDDLEDKKLRLPNAFVSEFEGELSDVANVVDPNGHAWEVGLTKSEKHVWFDNGWHEFIQHYSICCGYVLVFGYRGSSNFSVLICDMTAYEIHYPNNGPERTDQGATNGEKCSTDNGGGVADDDYAESLGSPYIHSLPRRILKENSSNVESGKRAEEQNQEINEHQPTAASSKTQKSKRLCRTRSKKTMMEEQVDVRKNDACKSKRGKFDEQGMTWTWTPLVNEMKDGKNEFLLKFKGDGEIINSSMAKREGDGEMINGSMPKSEGDGEMINGSMPKSEGDGEMINRSMFTSGFTKASRKSERAIHSARKFKTKSPSFMVVLRPHHLYNSLVHLPAEFSRKYMSNAPDYIKLQVSDGREWVSRMYRTSRSLTIGSGWRYFCKENNLDEGDVLVFEWIKKEITMKISIFHAVQNDEMD